MLRQEWSSRREKNRQFQRQLAVAGQNLNPVRAKRRLLGKGPGQGTGALAIAKAVDGGSDQRQLQLGSGLGEWARRVGWPRSDRAASPWPRPKRSPPRTARQHRFGHKTPPGPAVGSWSQTPDRRDCRCP